VVDITITEKGVIMFREIEYRLVPEARIKDGLKRKVNWAKRYNKMVFAFRRTLGIVHSHNQENARRVRQIKKGMLKIS